MIAGELLQSYREGESEPGDSVQRLTARQREVLQLFAEGRSAKEVAAVLRISNRTAEFHQARILGSQRTWSSTRFATESSTRNPG